MEIINTDNQIFTIQKESFSSGKLTFSEFDSMVPILVIFMELFIFHDSIFKFIQILENPLNLSNLNIDKWILAKAIFALTLIAITLFSFLTDILFRKSKISLDTEQYVFDLKNNILHKESSDHIQAVCRLNEINGILLLAKIEGGLMDVSHDIFGGKNISDLSLTNSTYEVTLNLTSGKSLILEKNSISIFSRTETQEAFRSLISKTNRSIQKIKDALNIEDISIDKELSIDNIERTVPSYYEYQGNSSQDIIDAENNLLSKKIDYSAFLIIGTIAIIAFLIYWPTSIELSCNRTLESSLECRLTRYTPLLRNGSAKISNPLAVDLIENHYDSDISYTAKFRSSNTSYSYEIITTENHKLAQKVENEINSFLLDSDESSFFRKYR